MQQQLWFLGWRWTGILLWKYGKTGMVCCIVKPGLNLQFFQLDDEVACFEHMSFSLSQNLEY